MQGMKPEMSVAGARANEVNVTAESESKIERLSRAIGEIGSIAHRLNCLNDRVAGAASPMCDESGIEFSIATLLDNGADEILAAIDSAHSQITNLEEILFS